MVEPYSPSTEVSDWLAEAKRVGYGFVLRAKVV
jgi:hypothetical protein